MTPTFVQMLQSILWSWTRIIYK